MGIWTPGPGATGGNDTFTGDASNETADGLGGDDILNGGDGNDTLTGGAGNDIVSGGDLGDTLILASASDIGFDTYDGGSGFDTFRVTATGLMGLQEATFVSIERLEFAGGDVTNLQTRAHQYGAGLSLTLQVAGTASSDILTIIAAPGSPTTLDISGFTTSNWGAGDLFLYSGNALADNFTGTNFEDDINGNDGSDTLRGLNGGDTISGGNGGDSIYGGDNNDILQGGDGNDVLRGENDNDVLIGGAGADTLAGGAGTDSAFYAFATSAVTVNLNTGLGSGGEAAGDTYASIEGITGSAYGDTLTGRDYFNNVIDGGAGDDTIEGGYGADALFGGIGIDTVVYSASLTPVDIRLFNSTSVGGQANGDLISDFENIIGSQFTDVLAGDHQVNQILGLNGNETITGREGDDYLDGGNGNDTLLGGADNDYLIGGVGNDTLGGGSGDDLADYSASNVGVTINLATGAGSGGHAQGDTLVSIEDVIGSQHDDVIIGKANAWDNVFNGQYGNDTITGGLGNDEFVYGMGAGNDIITDFVAGGADDFMHMRNWGTMDTFAEVMAFGAQVGANTVFTFASGQTLTLNNVTMGNLTSADFIFS